MSADMVNQHLTLVVYMRFLMINSILLETYNSFSKTINRKKDKTHIWKKSVFYLTLTRPIGLPPNAPVAQKIADQR